MKLWEIIWKKHINETKMITSLQLVDAKQCGVAIYLALASFTTLCARGPRSCMGLNNQNENINWMVWLWTLQGHKIEVEKINSNGLSRERLNSSSKDEVQRKAKMKGWTRMMPATMTPLPAPLSAMTSSSWKASVGTYSTLRIMMILAIRRMIILTAIICLGWKRVHLWLLLQTVNARPKERD